MGYRTHSNPITLFLHCTCLTRTGCLQDPSSTYEDSINHKIQHPSWLKQHWFTTTPLTRIFIVPQCSGFTPTRRLQDTFSTYEESGNIKNNKEACYSNVGSPVQAVLKLHSSPSVTAQPAMGYRTHSNPITLFLHCTCLTRTGCLQDWCITSLHNQI